MDKSERVKPGDFSWISDENSKNTLKDIYDAVEKVPGAWYNLHSYPIPEKTENIQLYSEIKILCTIDDTKNSFDKNIRIMQEISLKGWDEWVKSNLKIL